MPEKHLQRMHCQQWQKPLRAGWRKLAQNELRGKYIFTTPRFTQTPSISSSQSGGALSRGNTLYPRKKKKNPKGESSMLACYRSVPHGTLWSSYKSPRIVLDSLLSDFRKDVLLSHLCEWKLCPLPSMLMQAGKLPSVQEITLLTFPVCSQRYNPLRGNRSTT